MMELRSALDLRPKRNWRSTKNLLGMVMMGLCVVVVLVPLAAVIYAVIHKGAGVAFRHFPDFFTKDVPIISRKAGPGMGPAIVGTLLVTGGATLIAVPLGILGAVYLHEYGGNTKLARVVRFMAMVMTGVRHFRH